MDGIPTSAQKTPMTSLMRAGRSREPCTKSDPPSERLIRRGRGDRHVPGVGCLHRHCAETDDEGGTELDGELGYLGCERAPAEVGFGSDEKRDGRHGRIDADAKSWAGPEDPTADTVLTSDTRPARPLVDEVIAVKHGVGAGVVLLEERRNRARRR